MSKLITVLCATAGLGIASASWAESYSPHTTSMSQESYKMAKTNADTEYKIEKNACSSRSGNAEDICVAEAKGKANVAKAEAEAAYDNTPKTREAARVARAEARYDVAIEKCDDLAGNPKDVCVKEGKAALVQGTADAKVDRVTADTRNEAATKQTDARDEANAEKHDANTKVALEKCDALAGAAKDACVGDAKMH
ncbi:MAG: hypothetical protein HYX63_12510 [Gammaproteobacteria bacterium]|nr:hypothetical protein [Gammaproteobacteria bacterium]